MYQHFFILLFRLAKKSGYQNLEALKEEHMKMLLTKGQFEKAGQVLEEEGNYEQAMSMYIKSNRLIRASTLLLQQPNLINDHTLVASVLKNLLKQELFEAAAEIYKHLDKTELSMECYRKGMTTRSVLLIKTNKKLHECFQIIYIQGNL